MINMKTQFRILIIFIVFGVVQFIVLLSLDDYWHTGHGSLYFAVRKAFLITIIVEIYGYGMYRSFFKR